MRFQVSATRNFKYLPNLLKLGNTNNSRIGRLIRRVLALDEPIFIGLSLMTMEFIGVLLHVCLKTPRFYQRFHIYWRQTCWNEDNYFFNNFT